MAKITLIRGVSNANAEPGAEPEAPEDAELADVEAEPAEEAPVLERPSSRAVRQDWADWAAEVGYHGPCVEALTVAQIQALPDGPPVYDDDGLLVTPEDASNETAQAIGVYNTKALELYDEPDLGAEAEEPAEDTAVEEAEPSEPAEAG